MNGPPVEFALWIEVEAIDHQGDGETQDLGLGRTATFQGGFGSEGETAVYAAAHALAALVGTARELAQEVQTAPYLGRNDKVDGLAGAVMRQTDCLQDGGES